MGSDDGCDNNSFDGSSSDDEDDFMMLQFVLSMQQSPAIQRTPCTTSVLTGHERMVEFLNGHYERMHNRFRMTTNCFMRLANMFEETGRLTHGRKVSVQEQVMIFLYVVAQNATCRTSREEWQHSTSTISRYFTLVCTHLYEVSGQFIREPNWNTVHSRIHDDMRFFPFFEGCVGAIDGTHVAANVPKHLATPYLGWEGSVHDARVLRAATNDPIYNFPHPPPGKYFLVDAGYANRYCFLSPYQKTNYHLSDRRRQGGDKKKELFNYRHVSLRNAIESTFGIWKNRFPILKMITNFPLEKQCMIPIACAVVHNFIKMHAEEDELFREAMNDDYDVPATDDPEEVRETSTRVDDVGGSSTQAENLDDFEMGQFRDGLKDAIWRDSNR
ncbi:hypothetical protein UlMin_028138 [Ulmus minor]